MKQTKHCYYPESSGQAITESRTLSEDRLTDCHPTICSLTNFLSTYVLQLMPF